MDYLEAVGRRKAATARVRVYPEGAGAIIINERPVDQYFHREKDLRGLRDVLAVSGLDNVANVTVRVKGGGISGQAGAIRLGIARALVKLDPELRGELRRGGYLTRDPRVKERKKPGLKRARKAPQYTKR
jgi:small subunit ribosomal protein S9